MKCYLVANGRYPEDWVHGIYASKNDVLKVAAEIAEAENGKYRNPLKPEELVE